MGRLFLLLEVGDEDLVESMNTNLIFTTERYLILIDSYSCSIIESPKLSELVSGLKTSRSVDISTSEKCVYWLTKRDLNTHGPMLDGSDQRFRYSYTNNLHKLLEMFLLNW